MTIYNAPAGMLLTSIQPELLDNIAETESPFDMNYDQLDFGGDMWMLSLVFPWMSERSAGELVGWVDLIRRPGNAGRVTMPLSSRLGGATSTQLTVAGTANAGARTVAYSGLSGTLGAGSFFTVGDHLHRTVLSTSAASGTLNFEPRLRSSVTVGQIIQLANPTGLWKPTRRLLPEFSGSMPGKVKSMSLSLREYK